MAADDRIGLPHFDDEAAIGVRLMTMDKDSRTAFAAACAERLWPLAERYFASTGASAIQIARLRAGLDAVWRSSRSEAKEIADVGALAESLVPDDQGPWAPEVGYGQNAIAAIAFASRVWLTDDLQDAVRSARQVYEAADYAAQQSIGGGQFTADAEKHLLASPVVREALKAIAADLDAAAGGVPESLRKQARDGGSGLAALCPKL